MKAIDRKHWQQAQAIKVDENVVHCTRGDEDTAMYIKLIGVTDAAKMLCISPKTLRNLVKSGEIPASDIGNKWLFKLEDLTCYIEKKQIKPEEKGEQNND